MLVIRPDFAAKDSLLRYFCAGNGTRLLTAEAHEVTIARTDRTLAVVVQKNHKHYHRRIARPSGREHMLGARTTAFITFLCHRRCFFDESVMSPTYAGDGTNTPEP